jgi:gluconokinase
MGGDNVGKGLGGDASVGTCVVVMGPSGCGKTTIGKLLAKARDLEFIDADDHHSDRSVEKMRRGEGLTDADRWPWLNKLSEILRERSSNGGAVLACSALKDEYRRLLADGNPSVVFVYLEVPRSDLRRRLQSREGHYAGDALLESQLQTLEPPQVEQATAATVHAGGTIEEVFQRVQAALNSQKSNRGE